MKNGKKGGRRSNAGRPRKADRDNYVAITCVLRKDTVQQLRAGAGGPHRYFGRFLQWHLDRHPIPDHAEYKALQEHQPVYRLVKHKKVPVIIGRVRKAAVRPKLSPVREAFLKTFTVA